MAPLNEPVPEVQILDKAEYFTQAIVPIPSALPYAPLAPSSLRLRTRLIGLTSNNFTYAKFGFLFDWWDVHPPLPATTPAPYGDSDQYGRISAWGWAEVTESTYADVRPGSFVWGYLQIGTLAEDVAVAPTADHAAGQVLVTSEHRRNLMPFYNRYRVALGPAAESVRRDIEGRADRVAYDAFARVMFETAYLVNRYVLGAPATPPSSMTRTWTAEMADIRGATVFVLAPGSKAGACLAYELRHARDALDRPRQVVAVASDRSRDFVTGTGLYDTVLSAGVATLDALAQLGVSEEEKVVVIDFGGRDQLGAQWSKTLKAHRKRHYLMLDVGSEISEVAASAILAGFGDAENLNPTLQANDVREQAMKLHGGGAAEYFERMDAAWDAMLSRGGIKGLKVRWGAGMQDVKAGWERLAKADVDPDEALVFAL
ncbi:hypothetical protein F4778DRAFT_773286 [Xylariomycetidae sp. FL2044]|nr:hypothetical protein F4778DRAFT_773286 [Xylariomycetidae sp. FL2044]